MTVIDMKDFLKWLESADATRPSIAQYIFDTCEDENYLAFVDDLSREWNKITHGYGDVILTDNTAEGCIANLYGTSAQGLEAMDNYAEMIDYLFASDTINTTCGKSYAELFGLYVGNVIDSIYSNLDASNDLDTNEPILSEIICEEPQINII